MSEKKDPGGQWRQTSVVIRADIFLKAGEMGLDISNECNQALAHLVGIDYRQQQINDRAISDHTIPGSGTPPKGDEQTTPKPRAPVLHPVINADDPAAIAKVMKTRRQPPQKPEPEIPVAAEFPHRERISHFRLLCTVFLLLEKERQVHQTRKEKMTL